MRETGLTVVMRRSLRALADALRQPASCTQTRQNPALHAHAEETQLWPVSWGHTQATELPRDRPGYALGRLARLARSPWVDFGPRGRLHEDTSVSGRLWVQGATAGHSLSAFCSGSQPNSRQNKPQGEVPDP